MMRAAAAGSNACFWFFCVLNKGRHHTHGGSSDSLLTTQFPQSWPSCDCSCLSRYMQCFLYWSAIRRYWPWSSVDRCCHSCVNHGGHIPSSIYHARQVGNSCNLTSACSYSLQNKTMFPVKTDLHQIRGMQNVEQCSVDINDEVLLWHNKN